MHLNPQEEKNRDSDTESRPNLGLRFKIGKLLLERVADYLVFIYLSFEF